MSLPGDAFRSRAKFTANPAARAGRPNRFRERLRATSPTYLSHSARILRANSQGTRALPAPYVHDLTHDNFFSNQFHIVSSLLAARPSHYGTALRPFGPMAPQPVCQFELQPQLQPLAPPAL